MADELPSYNFFRPRWVARWLGRLLDRCVPRLADRRIPHSENMAEFFRQQGLLDHTEPVIPFGINLENVAQGDRARLRSAYGLGDEPVVLYAGVLNQFQRLDLLIDAMPEVVRQFPTAKLLLVTTIRAPELEGELRRRAADAGLGDRLIVTEPQSLRSVQELLAIADVTVTPRVDEPGFPIKLLNYMAARKASVAYASSARGLEHQRHAYLASPNTPEALGAAIAEVLGDGVLRERLEQQGYKYVSAHHDRRQIARRLVEVYLRTVLQSGAADGRAIVLGPLPACVPIPPARSRRRDREATPVCP
jgi:glycosyltransferase involved in cell wall biosynthesis